MSELSLKDIIAPMEAHEAVDFLTGYIESTPDDDTAYTLRGKCRWALNDRAGAITDYLAAIKINPSSPAKMYIKTAYEILNYYNKDLYNP